MPGQVAKHLQQERCRELAAVEAELRAKYYRSLLGMRLRVLMEAEVGARSEELGASELKGEAGRGQAEGNWVGTSCRYATVELPLGRAIEGRFIDVAAAGTRGECIVGQFC
jgi:tRNA A37 methylthiotransferase MiaB